MAHDLKSVGVFLVSVLAATVVTAQGDGQNQYDPAPDAFGIGLQQTVIHASQWQSRQGANPDYILGMIFPPTTGQHTFWTQVELPVGAQIYEVCFDVFDGDFTGRWNSLALMGYEAGGEGYGNAAVVVGIQQAATGWAEGDGYRAECATLAQPVTVRTWGDLDGDSTPHRIAYGFIATAENNEPGEIAWLNLWGATVTWNRLISPAPLFATFGDVPTGHTFFRHIEALVDSGITAGCGGGNSCPDNPVTRGQRAVFLAKALGLHWSN